jgi:alpha-L-fucosidase
MTAKHGDEFAMWPSQFTPRNAMDMGPERDLVGDLTRTVRNSGMKMGYYHNTTYSFWDARYPDNAWVEYMNSSIKELIEMYQPDILWGDVVIGPARDENGKPLGADHWNSKELIAYYYNHSPEPDQVVTNDRWGLDMTVRVDSKKALSQSVWSDLAERWNLESQGALLGDFQTPERRNVNEIFDFPWETCNSLDPTSWGYNKFLPEEEYMSTNELVDQLVDIVSKNGNLLINIGPRADGTIPEVMQDRLRGIGEWLNVNGEAIYGSTYWDTFQEGPVRFTSKDDILYATALDWPGGQLTLTEAANLQVNNITLLGAPSEIQWEMTPDGLVIQLPDSPPSPHANVLKIEVDEL